MRSDCKSNYGAKSVGQKKPLGFIDFDSLVEDRGVGVEVFEILDSGREVLKKIEGILAVGRIGLLLLIVANVDVIFG